MDSGHWHDSDSDYQQMTDGHWELGSNTIHRLTSTREVCTRLPPPSQVDYTKWVTWRTSFEEWVGTTGHELDYMGPKTLRALLTLAVDGNMLEVTEMRSGGWWRSDKFTWAYALSQLCESCGLT